MAVSWTDLFRRVLLSALPPQFDVLFRRASDVLLNEVGLRKKRPLPIKPHSAKTEMPVM